MGDPHQLTPVKDHLLYTDPNVPHLQDHSKFPNLMSAY